MVAATASAERSLTSSTGFGTRSSRSRARVAISPSADAPAVGVVGHTLSEIREQSLRDLLAVHVGPPVWHRRVSITDRHAQCEVERVRHFVGVVLGQERPLEESGDPAVRRPARSPGSAVRPDDSRAQ
jgi:hypothetical protein